MSVLRESNSMDTLVKLEKRILSWFNTVPHLPESVRKWLGDNLWWIAVIGLVISAIGAVSVLFTTLLSSAASVAYVLPTFAAWQLITGMVLLGYLVIECILLGLAIKPLQSKQKKGWVLLYLLWLVGILFVVVQAVLTLNPFLFILQVLFGAIWVAISGYFLFEVHGQFGHVIKSPGVKAEEKKKA